MTSLLDSMRGTVRHIAWYVSWRTGAPEAVRATSRRLRASSRRRG